MTIKCEKRQENGYWNLYVNGTIHIQQESSQICDNVKFHLENPLAFDFSECCEVAESIRQTL